MHQLQGWKVVPEQLVVPAGPPGRLYGCSAAVCGETGSFMAKFTSSLLRFTMTRLPPPECLWLAECFASPQEEFYHHHTLAVFQVFWCWWTFQWIPSRKNVPKCWFDHCWCFCYLPERFVQFLNVMMAFFICMNTYSLKLPWNCLSIPISCESLKYIDLTRTLNSPPVLHMYVKQREKAD